jgi:hypothetical protein
VSSRERKRAARRKRKERSSAAAPEAPPVGDELAPAGGAEPDDGNGDEQAPDAADPSTLAAEAEARGISRSELKNEQARERLEPLAEGERPLVVTIGAVISLLIAASIVIAWLAGVEVRVGNTDAEEEPNLFQVVPPAILFAVMGVGMLRARYWAVLGFQAIMAIIMIGAVITLVTATSVFQAVSLALVLAIAGALFWFTVKALARIQMPSPGDRTRGR